MMAPASSVTLSDGTAVELTRKDGVPDATWNEVIKFVKENETAVKTNPQITKILSEHPEHVPELNKLTNDSEAMKNFMESVTLAAQVSNEGKEKMQALENDPELKPMFDDIKANGPDAMMKYLGNEELMRKVSQKHGGINPETMKMLTTIQAASVTLHDAAKNGDLAKIEEFLKAKKDVNARDMHGVTPLGYAVGHDKLPVVKALIDAKANMDEIDAVGNSAVHFAAGYNRVQVLNHLLSRGASAVKVNQAGMTALAAAQQNQHGQVMTLLQRAGAK